MDTKAFKILNDPSKCARLVIRNTPWGVWAELEVSGLRYCGDHSDTVAEALMALDRDIETLNGPADPFGADYEALAGEEVASQYADSRDAVGLSV